MIESIIIKNFQKHEYLDLPLDKITTIVGPSDAGKSSILRAMRWVATNKPSGDSFVTHNKDKTLVQVVVDGKTIVRQKGTENLYSLDDKDFKAFGSDVPPEVEKALNLSPKSFQGQFDAPFWLSETPGQVSRELNSVVDLEVMDNVLGLVASELRTANLTKEVSLQRLTEARKNKKELDWVKELNFDLKRVEKIDYKVKEIEMSKKKMEKSVLEITEMEKQRKELQSYIDDLKNVVENGELANPIQEMIDRIEFLIEDIEDTEDRIMENKREKEAIEKEIHENLKGRCPLCGSKKKPQ